MAQSGQKLTTKSVLNTMTGNPVSYEVGETSALRQSITNRKAGTAIEPTPAQKKPIPAVARPKNIGRTY